MKTQQWLEFQLLVERSLSNIAGRFRHRIKKVSLSQPYREELRVLIADRIPTTFFYGLSYPRQLWLRYQLRQVLDAENYGDAEARLIKISDSFYRLARRIKDPSKRRTISALSIRLYGLSQSAMTLGICHWANFTSRRLSRFLRENHLEDHEVMRRLDEVANLRLTSAEGEVLLTRTTLKTQLNAVHDYILRHYCLDMHPV